MAKPGVEITVIDDHTILLDGVRHVLVPSSVICDGCVLRRDRGYICRKHGNELPTCISQATGSQIWVPETPVQKEIVPAQC